MTASLSDILTTQKNGVVAINGLSQSLSTLLGPTSTAASSILQQMYINAKTTKFYSGTPGTSYAIVYTSPTSTNSVVTDIDICNTTSGALNLYISLVEVSGTASANNALFYQTSVPAFSTLQWTGNQALLAGETIQVKSSAAGLTVKISGVLNT